MDEDRRSLGSMECSGDDQREEGHFQTHIGHGRGFRTCFNLVLCMRRIYTSWHAAEQLGRNIVATALEGQNRL